jgi:hypothetical protein
MTILFNIKSSLAVTNAIRPQFDWIRARHLDRSMLPRSKNNFSVEAIDSTGNTKLCDFGTSPAYQSAPRAGEREALEGVGEDARYKPAPQQSLARMQT